MIDAAKTPPVAGGLGADNGAAMAAGIEEAMYLAGMIAAEDDGPSGDTAGDKVARGFDFGGMPDIDPALGEDLLHLRLKDRRRDQRLAVEKEFLLPGIINDEGVSHQAGIQQIRTGPFSGRGVVIPPGRNSVKSRNVGFSTKWVSWRPERHS